MQSARNLSLSLLVSAMLMCALPVSSLSAQALSWTLDPTPSIRLGASESPDATLSAPAGATRLPNGNIVVGDLGDWALREFTPQGAVVRRYGRKGKGPGEISYLAPLLRCGDSLVANDITMAGPSIFKMDGSFVRAMRVKPQIYRMSCNGRMQFLIMGWETKPERKSGVHRPRYPFYLAGSDSTAPLLLGEFAGPDRFSVPGGDRPLPLGHDPRIAIGPSRAYIAESDSFEIKVFDLQGKALTPLLAREPRITATKGDLDAEREREIAMIGERARKSITQDYSTIPLAQYLPATRDMLIDPDGNLWVQHFPRANSPSVRWTVFSTAGRVMTTVTMPSALEVYEIGRDYVLGRYVDPDESVPEVRLYRLRRR